MCVSWQVDACVGVRRCCVGACVCLCVFTFAIVCVPVCVLFMYVRGSYACSHMSVPF